MPDIHFANECVTVMNSGETEQQKKQRTVSSVIEQVGQLDRQAQISVLRSVAAFFELDGELG